MARTVARELGGAAGNIAAHQLTTAIPEALFARWRKRYAPHTLNQRRYVLRSLLRWLAKMGGAPELASFDVRIQRPKPRQTTTTNQEVQAILRSAPIWLRLFVLLAYDCALRFSEALTLAPMNYNQDTRTITLKTKGGSDHTIPVSDDIRKIFDSLPNPDPSTSWLEQLKGTPLTKHAVRYHWKRIRAKTRINPRLTPHDLRRTAATQLYDLTRDIRAVQTLLHHSTLKTTVEYIVDRDPETLRPLLQQLRSPTELKQ